MFSRLNDSTQSIDALETVAGHYNGMRATVFETTQDMMNGTLNYDYEMEITIHSTTSRLKIFTARSLLNLSLSLLFFVLMRARDEGLHPDPRPNLIIHISKAHTFRR
jgi:hypothetical protein